MGAAAIRTMIGSSSSRVPRCTMNTPVVNNSNRFSENATMRIASLLCLPALRPILLHPHADRLAVRCRHTPATANTCRPLPSTFPQDETDWQLVLVNRGTQVGKYGENLLRLFCQFTQSCLCAVTRVGLSTYSAQTTSTPPVHRGACGCRSRPSVFHSLLAINIVCNDEQIASSSAA